MHSCEKFSKGLTFFQTYLFLAFSTIILHISCFLFYLPDLFAQLKSVSRYKGRTIRKMPGKKIRAAITSEKKNSCKQTAKYK
jgi:hypothetical protein